MNWQAYGPHPRCEHGGHEYETSRETGLPTCRWCGREADRDGEQ